MNSERKLITEYFNKYYPKKTYYVHNEVFELLLGVFFGFFFSALKDSIGNRAVQVVSSFQDEGKSKRFFDEAEKVTSELERYAKKNEELSDKLEKIEEVLKKLQSSTTQLQENPSKTKNVPFKEQPVVTELSKFTTEVFNFLKEAQQESKQQNKELQDTLSTVVKVLRQLGVNQTSLVENFKKQTENAVESGTVSRADVQQAEIALNNTLGSKEPSVDVEPQTSGLSTATPLQLNQLPKVSTSNGSVTLTYGTNEISFVNINTKVTTQLIKDVLNGLPVSSEVKQKTVKAVKNKLEKDTTEAETVYVNATNGNVSTTETKGAVPVTVDSLSTLKELEKSNSKYTKKFVDLASKLNTSQLLLTPDAGKEKEAKEKIEKEAKEKIEKEAKEKTEKEEPKKEEAKKEEAKKEEAKKEEAKKEEAKKEAPQKEKELIKTKITELIQQKKVFNWSDFLKDSSGDESNTFTFTKIQDNTVVCEVSVVNYKLKTMDENKISKFFLESVVASVNLKNFFYKLFESEASDSQSSLGFPGFTGKYTLELALDKFNIEGDKLKFLTVQEIFILNPTVYYKSQDEWKEKRAVEFFKGLLNKKYPLSVFLSKGETFKFKSNNELSTDYLTFTKVIINENGFKKVEFKVFLSSEFDLTDTVQPQVSTFEVKQHLTQKSVTYYEAKVVTLSRVGLIYLESDNKEVEVNERTGAVTFTQKGTDEILKTIKALQEEVKEEQKKENKKEQENKEKESVLLNTLEGFISKKLKFPIVELSEKKTSLKASESLVQYFTFENLTEDKESVVVTGEVQNLSTDSTEPFSTKVELNERKQSLQNLLYVLFEEENKKKYSGTFKVTLKVKKDFQVEGKKVFLSPEGAQKVLSAVTEAKQPVQTQQPATQGSEVSVQEPEQEPETPKPEAEPETVPTQPTVSEKPTEKKPQKVERWPELLYYAQKKRGTLPLKENSPLLIESPKSGTFVRLKYDSVDKATNVAMYVGEVEYDAQTALPKSALSAVLEVVLNQERGQQLKVLVASYVSGEYSVVSVLQKGKLTSDGSSTLTRLLSTGDSEANKQLASDNFATGVLSGNQVSLKNFTTLPTDNQNYVLVFPVGSSLLFLPLTEDKLPETLTALRGLARQKSKTFSLYNANEKKITVQGHDEKDFQSNLLVIIEKLKSLVKPQNYSKALQQSRTQFKQPKIDSDNVKFGFLSGSFDKEKGFKGPYTVLGAQEKQQ